MREEKAEAIKTYICTCAALTRGGWERYWAEQSDQRWPARDQRSDCEVNGMQSQVASGGRAAADGREPAGVGGPF